MLKLSWQKRMLFGLVGIIGQGLIRTLRITVIDIENYFELSDSGQPVILTTWHSRLLLVARYGGLFQVSTLISPSRDGEMAARIAKRLGITTLRGNTNHRPVRALRDLVNTLRALRGLVNTLRGGNNVGLFPDGPLGPACKVKPGILFLAQRAQCPILPVGADAAWKIALKSWDHFVLPLPFSRVILVVGAPIHIPSDPSPEILIGGSKNLEVEINTLTERAAAYLR